MAHSEDYWYKKYIEEKFSSINKIQKMTAHSLTIQADEYARRLGELNGEAGRLRSIQTNYIPREVFEASIKAVQDKTEVAETNWYRTHNEFVEKTIKPMQEFQYKLMGKIAVIVVVGGAVWGIVIAVVLWILDKNFK